MKDFKKIGTLFFIVSIGICAYAQDIMHKVGGVGEVLEESITLKTNDSANTTKWAKKLGRNIVSVNTLNFLNNNIHIGYERILGIGMIGAKLSVNVNYLDKNLRNSTLKYQRDFTAGIDINIYPAGQGKVKYFLGPSFRIGTVSNGVYELHGIVQEKVTYNYQGFFFTNGVVIQPTKRFYTSLQAAVGIERFEARRQLITAPALSTETYSGFVTLNLGYRF